MAFIKPTEFTSKKGKLIRIRCVEENEAFKLKEAMVEIAKTSPFILSTPQDFQKMTLEQEQKFISSHNEHERYLLIVAEHENRFVGILNFSANRKKAHHRGYLGISLHHDYRKEGIAKMLFSTLIDFSKTLTNLKYLELDMMSSNQDAFELYKKVGFELVHVLPDAFEISEGKFVDNYFMRMKII